MADKDDGEVDRLAEAVRQAKRERDAAEAYLADRQARLEQATREMNRALGVPDSGPLRRSADGVSSMAMALMVLGVRPMRWADVRRVAKKFGRLLPPNLLYQPAYRSLTETTGGARRKLTAAGKDRLKKVLDSEDCRTLQSSIKTHLESEQ